MDEIARYVQARNRLLRLAQKWERIREEQILPEYREIAAQHRVTPRTGRKPSKAHKCNRQGLCKHCGLEIQAEHRKDDCTAPGAGTRADREELRAADNRALYAEFIAAGGSYATWHLAAAATKKAKHLVRDEYAGRAGMIPDRLRWDGSILQYGTTQWSVHAKQLAKRPIPEEARIAQAWLQRERTTTSLLRKPHYVWQLVVVLDEVSPRMHPVKPNRTAAAIDIAWRQDQDTLRVAYVADDAGHHRPIRLRPEHYQRFQHAASIASLVDLEANKLRTKFRVPDNTSHRRLLELATDDADREIGEHMVHLEQWHHGGGRNLITSRDQHYLEQVHALCAAHHTIYIEDMKGSPKLVQKASTRKKHGAAEDAEGGVAREQRQMVAPFSFLRMLQREAGKFACDVIAVPAAYTSRICVACDYDMGPRAKLERTCVGCGQRWDIDHLAALNLLRWGTARKPTDEAAK